MAEHDLHKDFDALKKDFEQLRKDLKDLSKAGGDAANDVVDTARKKLEAEADKLMASLRDASGEAKKRGNQAVQEVEGYVEDRPFSSVIATFGIGFVIGWLIGRK